MKSKLVRLSRFTDRQVMRLGSGLILTWLSCKPALADLPSVEAPESSGGTGLMGQIKGYAQDFIVFAGLLVCAVAFINVATSAVHTFVEVRNERATWTKFGSIVATGVVLLVATIWLLGQSAEIIL